MDGLRQALRDGSIVFFGGAGVSTESGIPDFRSSTGLYTLGSGARRPPEYMLSHDCLVSEPEEFFAFYRANMLYPAAQPNAAHRALARLEDEGRLTAVVTQNIDGLHQAAGSRTVWELHGSVHRNLCTGCGATYPLAFVLETTGVPRCPACGAVVRPDVVLYGEMLDDAVVDAAQRAVAAADVLVVGGTSLNVYPAAGLVRWYSGDRLVIVNKEPTPYDDAADLVVHGTLGDVLTAALA